MFSGGFLAIQCQLSTQVRPQANDATITLSRFSLGLLNQEESSYPKAQVAPRILGLSWRAERESSSSEKLCVYPWMEPKFLLVGTYCEEELEGCSIGTLAHFHCNDYGVGVLSKDPRSQVVLSEE